jgi:hypothetical protein
VDLDALWKQLGVKMENGKVTLLDDAPLAGVRRAITAAPRGFAVTLLVSSPLEGASEKADSSLGSE